MSLGDFLVTPLPDCETSPLADQIAYQGGPWANTTISPLPKGPWTPNPILPDSILPPALQRHQQFYDLFKKNKWDLEIEREAKLWKYVAEHGGIQTCCRIPELGAPIWSQPPWEVMPSQAPRIEFMKALPIGQVSGGGPFTGVDTILGTYNVPSGYDGAINRFVCAFSGNGFFDFSGSIVWRLKVGQRYAKNLGAVQNTYGSFQTAFIVPGTAIRLISGQAVQLIANIPVGSPVNGGQVQAGIFGWTYPRR